MMNSLATTPAGATQRNAPCPPRRIWLDDGPRWTSHDAGASRFDDTLRLPGRVRRELGHIEPDGVRRVGVLVVEFDAWVPVALATAEPMPA